MTKVCRDPLQDEKDADRAQAKEFGDDHNAFLVGCEDTILTNDDVAATNPKIGDSLEFSCRSGCAEERQHPIFGDGVFSEDSHLCAAAMWSGAIQTDGGHFSILIGSGKESFKKGVKRNGVMPQAKLEPSDLS